MPTPKIIQDIRDLKDNVENLISDNLTGKYYIPTVSTGTGTPSTVNTNPLPSTWTGSGQSYSNGGYTIECSVAPSGANPLNSAFDRDESSRLIMLATPSNEASVTITLPDALTIQSFRTYLSDSVSIDQVSIQGSNNKSSWTTIYTYNSLDSEMTTRTVDSPASYKYYRFLYAMDATGSVEVREIQIGSYQVPSLSNAFTLADVPNPLDTNQRIMIKTPTYSNTGVSSNTFNGKNIDALLLPNRYYELVYNGTQYLAKEVV